MDGGSSLSLFQAPRVESEVVYPSALGPIPAHERTAVKTTTSTWKHRFHVLWEAAQKASLQ